MAQKYVQRSFILWLMLFSLLFSFFSFHVSASFDEVPAQFLSRVQVQYKQQCAVCHGDNAQGNISLNAPVLAGQYAWYLQRQLNNFAVELRGIHVDDSHGKAMVVIAKQLKSQPEELLQLTAYIESLSSVAIASSSATKSFLPTNEANIKAKLKNGSRYYQAKCGACHGGVAQGNKSFKAPELAGQDTDYLKRQMNNFVKLDSAVFIS